jgi:hypothetical protein
MVGIERKNDDRIDELEKTIVENLELIDCPVTHKFTNGMYIRQIAMPAGSLITSKIHKTQHPYTISHGIAAVSIDGQDWCEISAPYTGITEPGTRRVLYIVEDCIWTTYHPLPNMKSEYNDLNEEEMQKIVDDIENEILEPHINYLTGTNMHIEYKKAFNNKNL